MTGTGGSGPAAGRRLVLAGEAIADVAMRVPALPERGGDMLATGSAVTAGGGFNVMAAAARQGLPVLYAGGHGTGPWGDLVRAALAAEGIEVLRAPDPGRDTGFDVALVEPGGERSFVTHLGAEALPAPGSWDAVPLRAGDLVYVSGYGLAGPASGPVLSQWAAALPEHVTLYLDPGPLVAGIPPAVLRPVLDRCDWLSCNQREALLLTASPLFAASPEPSETPPPGAGPSPGAELPSDVAPPPGAVPLPGPPPQRPSPNASPGAELPSDVAPPGAMPALNARTSRPLDAEPSPEAGTPPDGVPPGAGSSAVDPAAVDAARRLRAGTRRAQVIVRVGAAGCLLALRPVPAQQPGLVTSLPAPAVTAVDTTGAGDAHAGVFLAVLAEGQDPATAARRANTAAALAVTRPGPATSPSRSDLDAWLAVQAR